MHFGTMLSIIDDWFAPGPDFFGDRAMFARARRGASVIQ
jgi:hypothetical protein